MSGIANDIVPFAIRATDAELFDLRTRLAATRWPDRETVDDWSQGLPLGHAQKLVAHWLERYDWREREARLNAYPQFLVQMGGQTVHVLHVRSPHAGARALLMTHGWPGSIVEFLRVVGPLTDPVAHGGDTQDAFHLVCPSLPGYGWSSAPRAPGFGVAQIATLWDELMVKLGYARYYAQGGDWGAAVTTQIGLQDRGHCAGLHVNLPLAPPTVESRARPTKVDRAALQAMGRFAASEAGYSALQSTKPQTLAYGLTDSPAAQCAWIAEKFHGWIDRESAASPTFTLDELLDNVMFYWLPRTAASSARLYWESFRQSFGPGQPSVMLPTGCSQFAHEISKPPRRWVEQRYPRLVYWNEVPAGGHFAAFECPDLFVREIRTCFRLMH